MVLPTILQNRIILSIKNSIPSRYILQNQFHRNHSKPVKGSKGKRTTRIPNMERAIEYFDVTYPPIYSHKWPSIRLGLFCKSKYVAVLNNYANVTKIEAELEELGAFNVGRYYNRRANEYLENLKMKEVKPKQAVEGELESSTERPSLKELTYEETVEEYYKTQPGIYPEKYRKQTTGIQDLDLTDTSRIIDPEMTGDTAIFNNFVPSVELKGLDEWMGETDVFTEQAEYVPSEEIGVKHIKESQPIPWPENLSVYSFTSGDISDFPEVNICTDSMHGKYYLMGGSSILPILALDLQPGDTMLDMCAAPGGKSFVALQTLIPDVVVSNDIDVNRLLSIKRIKNQYFPHITPDLHPQHSMQVGLGEGISGGERFDKVLVDAPCTNDRNALEIDIGNWFSPSKTKDRLNLPETQSNLLCNAIKLTKPGGVVVYSTCTLSPIQNDGVVHLALTKIWEKTTINCAVIDMTAVYRCYSFMYRLGTTLGLRYGQIVLPNLENNFGPMYIAKIQRLN